MEKVKKNTEGQVACVEKTDHTVITEKDIENMTQEELENKLRQLKKELLPGKCPVRVFERNGEVNINKALYKESYSSPIDALKYLTATSDHDLASEIMHRGWIAMPSTTSEENKKNCVLQALAEYSPRDPIEARLCLQANALYSQGMSYLARAEINDMIHQCDFYMKNAIKLLRLHNETIEALNKHRRGGEQRVVVQHVNVNDGGRAIVGGMFDGEGKTKK